MKYIKLKAKFNNFNQKMIFCHSADNDERLATIYEDGRGEFQNRQPLTQREIDQVDIVSQNFKVFWDFLMGKCCESCKCKEDGKV